MAIPMLFFHQVAVAGFPDRPWVEPAAWWVAVVLLAITLVLTVYSGGRYIYRAARILSSSEEP